MIEYDGICEHDSISCAADLQFYYDDCGKCGCVADKECTNPKVDYLGKGDAVCGLLDFICPWGTEYYRDECGCGCLQEKMCEFNPSVDYVALGDECQLADFFCEDAYVHYADECGCGCILDQRHCEYDSPDVIWFSTDPQICSQEVSPSECPVDTRFFQDECGCGCAAAPGCETDGDCRGGFCETQLEIPVCISSKCDDGSQVFCNALPPTCPPGQAPEVKDGCWGECISARTCEFICQNDRECAARNQNTVCIAVDCPPVEGFVCENICR